MSDQNRWGLPENLFTSPTETNRWGLPDDLFDNATAGFRNQYNDILNDPIFRDLYQAQSELRSVLSNVETTQDLFDSNRNVEISNLVEELTDELSIKYGVTPAEIGSLMVDRTDPLGQYAVKSLRGVTDVLEPVQAPQQIFFRMLSAQLESADRGDSFFETVRNIGASLGDVEYGKIFGPGLQEDVLTYGDILRQVGVTNQTAVRTFGFLGDILADPLLAGSYTRGLGLVARGAGATRAAESLFEIGNRVERALSPMGAVDVTRAVGRGVLGKAALDSMDRAMANAINGVLEFPFLNNRTLGEWFAPRGARVVGEGLEAEATRFLFPEAESRAVASVDDVVDRINQNVGEIEQIVGTQRTKNVFARIFDAFTGRQKSYDRLFNLPPELREVVESLATEAADNTSPLAVDDVLSSLEQFEIRTAPGAASLIAGEGPVGLPTIGGELREIAEAIGPRDMDLYTQNLERVRDTAIELGLNADEAVAAYQYVTNRLIESDVLIGWHRSMYEPMKEAFYENVFRMGMGSDEAQALWEEAIRMGGDGLTPARLGVEPNPKRFDLAARRMFEEGDVGVKARRYLLRTVYDQWNGQGLELTDWFTGLANGHLRRAYALNDRDWASYVRSVESGASMPNRLIDTALYSDALSQSVAPETMDLISEYVERISPTIPETRGFLVRQDGILQHLLRNGVNAVDANNAITAIIDVVAPELKDITRRLRDIASRRAGVAGARSAGPTSGATFSTERRELFGIETFQEGIEELSPRAKELAAEFEGMVPSTIPGVPSVYLNQAEFNGFLRSSGFSEGEANGVLRELNNVGDWDAEGAAEMGRYLQANIPILESARAMKAKYPVARFVADVYDFASKNNLLYRADALDVPDDFDLLSGTMYGPLDNTYVPRWVKNQVDNALRSPAAFTAGQSTGRDALYALNRVRSIVTGNWLASLPTTNANVIGGILSAAFAGENPVTFAFDTARVLRDARQAGGIRNLPEYREMGDILLGGGLANELSGNLRSARLEAIGERGNWLDAVDAIGDGLQSLQRRPIFGRAGGLFGLEAFQLTEDAMKMAQYRRVLERTGDKRAAYRSARNIVFDYSALPYALQLLRDTGILTFPGFTVFMTGRVFDAMVRRPGVLAAADRLGDAVWNAAIPSEEIKAGVSASMADFEREGNYVPITFDVEQGRVGLLPLQGLIPTRPWAGNPFLKSLQGLGVYQGLYDVVRAFGNQGAASVGAEYGQRVSEARAEGTPKQVSQIAQFLFNSYAPAFITRAYRFPAGTGGEAQGFIPELTRGIQDMIRPVEPGSMEDVMNRFAKIQSGREPRTLMETVIGGVLRSVRPVSLDPVMNPVLREATDSDYRQQQIDIEINRELNRLMSDTSLTPTERFERAKALIFEKMDGDLEQLKRYETVLQAIRTLDDLKNLRNR